jgi:hypothetical protein
MIKRRIRIEPDSASQLILNRPMVTMVMTRCSANFRSSDQVLEAPSHSQLRKRAIVVPLSDLQETMCSAKT